MIIPGLTDHLCGYRQTKYDSCAGGDRRFARASHDFHDQLPEGHYSHADPDRKRIERSGKRVVALTRLHRRLIQIKHNRYACHEEEEENHPELFHSAFACECLPYESEKAKDQRQHVEHVMSRIILAEIVGEQRLVAETCVVDKRNSRDPVAGIEFTLLVEHIILSSGEIPHEISHIHVDKLIIEEVCQILREGRTIAYLLRIVHYACSLIEIGLARQIKFRNLLAADLIDRV